MTVAQENEWEYLTPEEKKRRLYEQQKATLDTFLHAARSAGRSTTRASAI